MPGAELEVDRRTRALLEQVQARDDTTAVDSALAGTLQAPADRATIGLVPGVLYREHPETGGDGRRVHEICRRLGLDFRLIPCDERGRTEANAALILDWIEYAPKPLLLISLSRGSLELRRALATRPELFDGVIGWISVSGLPLGCAGVDAILAISWRRLALKIFFKLKGRQWGALTDLCRGTTPAASIERPPGMGFLQIAGFPMRSDITEGKARRSHQRLAPRPSDGFVWLDELTELGGTVVPVAGADHYLSHDDIDTHLAGLIGLTLNGKLQQLQEGR